MSLFFALLTVGANVFVLLTLGLAIGARYSGGAHRAFGRLREAVDGSSLAMAWVVALVATLGSLYYSEVAHLPPCTLCWYQRIAMYPLAIVLAIAALRSDFGIRRYVLPIVAIGAAISAYHYQLERFPSQTTLACSVDVPCTTLWVWQLHYISIPFMALSAFALIATLLLIGPSGDEVLGRGGALRIDEMEVAA
ncbi:MAG TPA: disulfide oxidoreductase [Actinomycetota bacterium]|nr:disulfide oxidoreductase [Actinomycetota bacterium]